MGEVKQALQGGARLVRGTLRYAGLAWLISFLLALPLAALMRSHLAGSMGRSLAATRLREGWDDLWFQGFEVRAKGLAATFQPSVVGVGAVLDGLDSMLTGNLWLQHGALLGVGLVYALAWVFLSAGFIGTYVGRGEGGFMARGAHLFPRFVALALLAAPLYGVILLVILPGLGGLVETINRETIDERIHFAWVAGKYLVVWLGVWVVSLVVDYARVLSARTPKRGLIPVVRGAVGLVWSRRGRVFGLSACLLLVGAALFGAHAIVAPGAGDATWAAVLAAFLVSQAYLFARILLRCATFASECVLADQPGASG